MVYLNQDDQLGAISYGLNANECSRAKDLADQLYEKAQDFLTYEL